MTPNPRQIGILRTILSMPSLTDAIRHGYAHEYIHSGSIFDGSRARETSAIAQGSDTAHSYVYSIAC
jgi:hypothetical protein